MGSEMCIRDRVAIGTHAEYFLENGAQGALTDTGMATQFRQTNRSLFMGFQQRQHPGDVCLVFCTLPRALRFCPGRGLPTRDVSFFHFNLPFNSAQVVEVSLESLHRTT